MKYLLFTIVVGASLLYLSSGEGKTRRVLEDIDIPSELSAAIGQEFDDPSEENAVSPFSDSSPTLPVSEPMEAKPESEVKASAVVGEERTPESESGAGREPESKRDPQVDSVITPPETIDTPATATMPVAEEELPIPGDVGNETVADEPGTRRRDVPPEVAARRAEVLDFESEDTPDVITESVSDRRARLLELSDDMALFAAEMIAR